MDDNFGLIMRTYRFCVRWYANSVSMIRTGDPLLMGAAIAYNTLFALFPLALAFFTILTFFDSASEAYTNVVDAINGLLPAEIAEFFTGILQDSIDAVAQDRLAIVVVSVLIALWSGSRAVYTIQKSLRVVQGVEENRGYVRARLTGIVVTVAGGTSLVVAYIGLLVSNNAWEEFARFVGMGSLGLGQFVAVLVVIGWIFLLLWVIYHFGPPTPFGHGALSAAIVSIVIVAGTSAAQFILPNVDVSSLMVLGTVGIVLIWLYCIGIVLVAIPVAVVGFFAAFDRQGPL